MTDIFTVIFAIFFHFGVVDQSCPVLIVLEQTYFVFKVSTLLCIIIYCVSFSGSVKKMPFILLPLISEKVYSVLHSREKYDLVLVGNFGIPFLVICFCLFLSFQTWPTCSTKLV